MMERTLCVWFPDWPLRRPDVLPAEPCQAIDDENLVVAVNKAAAIAGIRIPHQHTIQVANNGQMEFSTIPSIP